VPQKANSRPMDTAKRTELIAKTSEVFSPAAPINRRDLFAGRIEELKRVFTAVNTRGQHAVIYGERGVGKTSLANIIQDVSLGNQSVMHIAKVNCSQDDDFSTVWRKAFGEIQVERHTDASTISLRPASVHEVVSAAEMLPEKPSPHDIRKVAQQVGRSILILDEFDRVGKDQSLFADTIKTLSDSSTDCTLVIVGVARDIADLIKEHASVDRALVQIPMPRMATNELHEILTTAMDTLGMNMAFEARNLIVLLSQGLPHYTHVLGETATMEALRQNRWDITAADVHASINAAIQNTQQSIRSAYQQATASPRQDTLFKQVLLACALADVDDLGYFASSDVRKPLTEITGKPYDIPNYSQHLDKFSSSDRGNVLEKAGKQRRFRFRFSNPLLQPFVIMRGIAEGMLKGDLMKLLQRKSKSTA
jgi:Cdc6-like AAA superfamily ATPase